MASTAKGKGATKTSKISGWNKHLRPEGKREAAKNVRKDGKKQIKDAKSDEDEETPKKGSKPDYIDIDKDGNKKESMKKAVDDKKKKKVLKEENQIISNFIHNILERNYKDAHKYLEQIIQHKVVSKMRECKSDTLF
jgi:hypothetical protein